LGCREVHEVQGIMGAMENQCVWRRRRMAREAVGESDEEEGKKRK
jgi:hypothetical protein